MKRGCRVKAHNKRVQGLGFRALKLTITKFRAFKAHDSGVIQVAW